MRYRALQLVMRGMVVVITEIVNTYMLCVTSLQGILWSIQLGGLGASNLKVACYGHYKLIHLFYRM